jgi:hypothetical protein
VIAREARCSCGALRASCRGEPVRRSICHCLECQRRTGAPFGLNATFAAEQVEISGERTAYTRRSDEGFWVRTSFCPVCGSTVFYEIERRPGMVTIPVGAFADPAFPEPTVAIYDDRRHPWLRFDTSTPLQVD